MTVVRLRRKEAIKYDVVARDMPSHAALAAAVVESIALKGFATIDPEVDAATFSAALAEVRALDSAGRFFEPPDEVADGLLGEEGSAEICFLDFGPSSPPEDVADKPNLKNLDSSFTVLAQLMAPLAHGEIDLRFHTRSGLVLHRCGLPDQEPPGLSAQAANFWLAQLARSSLMLVYFLGPGLGRLELRPFHHEDAEPHQIMTEPGMLVILRADAMTHRFESTRKCYAVSTWLHKAGPEGQIMMTPKEAENGPPVVDGLMQWVLGCIKDLKDKEVIGPEGPEWNPEVPGHWRVMMNHMFPKGPRTAVYGMSCRWPSGWETDFLHLASKSGADLAVQVPITRWDHNLWFDDNPESFKWNKTNCAHGAFIDGVELFDPKPFGLNNYESKGMDPCQRHILEVGYESLIFSGYTKKNLMRSLIGVYVGAAFTEFSMVPLEGGISGTGASGAITSNRISFCLGMQGPSITFDTGAASSLVALTQSVNSLRFQTDTYVPNIATMTAGVRFSLAGNFYVSFSAAGILSPMGRCLVFDQTASGMVKSEGIGSIVSSRFGDKVDDDKAPDDRPTYGIIGAVSMNHSGRGATMGSPSGPQQKELVMETLRQGSLSPLDVESVECHGEGGLLTDALEANCNLKTLRDPVAVRAIRPETVPLSLNTVKSSQGHSMEATGMMQLLRVLLSMRAGVVHTNVHIYQLNPHIECWEGESVLFPTELIRFRHTAAFAGITARGNSGTTAHAIPFGSLDLAEQEPRKQVLKHELISFWPGGGGQLEERQKPAHYYAIVGSWSSHSRVELMEEETEGIYSFTVMIGINQFEDFVLRLDGDAGKVLHPDAADGAGASVKVPEGPDTNPDMHFWRLDARPQLAELPPGVELPAALESPFSPSASSKELVRDPHSDEDLPGGPRIIKDPYHAGREGQPGDLYRIQLHVAGKWRSVSWKRVVDVDQADARRRRDQYVDDGRYYVAGDWNKWSFRQEMTADRSDPGLYWVQVEPGSGSFVIVRNCDWEQSFFPVRGSMLSSAVGGGNDKEFCIGPFKRNAEFAWHISARAGESFRISFRRNLHASSQDIAATVTHDLSWEKVSPGQPQLQSLEN